MEKHPRQKSRPRLHSKQRAERDQAISELNQLAAQLSSKVLSGRNLEIRTIEETPERLQRLMNSIGLEHLAPHMETLNSVASLIGWSRQKPTSSRELERLIQDETTSQPLLLEIATVFHHSNSRKSQKDLEELASNHDFISNTISYLEAKQWKPYNLIQLVQQLTELGTSGLKGILTDYLFHTDGENAQQAYQALKSLGTCELDSLREVINQAQAQSNDGILQLTWQQLPSMFHDLPGIKPPTQRPDIDEFLKRQRNREEYFPALPYADLTWWATPEATELRGTLEPLISEYWSPMLHRLRVIFRKNHPAITTLQASNTDDILKLCDWVREPTSAIHQARRLGLINLDNCPTPDSAELMGRCLGPISSPQTNVIMDLQEARKLARKLKGKAAQAKSHKSSHRKVTEGEPIDVLTTLAWENRDLSARLQHDLLGGFYHGAEWARQLHRDNKPEPLRQISNLANSSQEAAATWASIYERLSQLPAEEACMGALWTLRHSASQISHTALSRVSGLIIEKVTLLEESNVIHSVLAYRAGGRAHLDNISRIMAERSRLRALIPFNYSEPTDNLMLQAMLRVKPDEEYMQGWKRTLENNFNLYTH